MRNFAQPWFIRKICYLVASIGLAILAALGLVDEQEGEQVAIAIGTAAGAIAPLIAALFTGQHSDDKTTTDDVVKAEQVGRANGVLAVLGADDKTVGQGAIARHSTENTVTAPAAPQALTLPVYTGPTTNEA